MRITRILGTAAIPLLALSASGAVHAQEPAAASAEEDAWYPSRYGADDRIGAANLLTPEVTKAAAKIVTEGKVYSLAIDTPDSADTSAHRKKSVTILSFLRGSQSAFGTNKLTANDDQVIVWEGLGTQIDGFGHVGINHVHYNGVPAADFVKPDGITTFSAHLIPPMVTKGILLDIPALEGVDFLPAGTAINSAQLKAAIEKQRVKIEPGSVVLLNTGWLQQEERSPGISKDGIPGLGLDGAQFLAGLGVVAIGADSYALEVSPPEIAGELNPVHQFLLVKSGIHVLENIRTEELADDKTYEFMFVLSVPKIPGIVQSIVNPLAIK